MSALAAWKTAHILSAAVLFGTGIGIAFFCWFGYRWSMRSGEIAVLRFTLRWTVIADAVFTAPAVVFQVVSGMMLMSLSGWPLTSAWALSVWFLYVVTGACWLPVVFIQVRLSRVARSTTTIAELPASFHRLFRRWLALGVPAFAAVIALFYLMVAKPLGFSGAYRF